MAILILSSQQDLHIHKVTELLEQKGLQVVVVNTRLFPQNISVSTCSCNQHFDQVYKGKDFLFRGSEISAVWVRRFGRPKSTQLWGNEISQLTGSQNLLSFFLKTIGSINAQFFPGKPNDIFFWEEKASQIPAAIEVGFELPDTLITTDYREVVEFYNQHSEIITKAATTFPIGTSPTTTRTVSFHDLVHIQRVQNYPVIFQEKVEKQADIRVAIIGNKIFASQIQTQETMRGKVDWRAAFVRKETVYQLPDDIQEKCLALMKRMNLTYGAIDLVLTPDGRYVFIEINPGGQWLWMEIELGLPLSQAVADYLMANEVS